MAEKFNKGARPGGRSNSERGDNKFAPKGDKFKGDSKKVYSRSSSAGEGRPASRFGKEGGAGYGDKKSGSGEKRFGGAGKSYGSSERSGYGDRSGAPKRSFGGNRSEGSDRPERSYGGNRSEGSGSGRSYGGNRSEGSSGRSFGGNRSEGSSGRSYGGNRSEGSGAGRTYGGNRSEGSERSFGGNRSEGSGRSYGGNRSEGKSFGGNRSEKPWSKSGSGFKKPGFGKGYGREEEFKKPEVPRGKPGERNRSFKNDKEFKPEMSERYDPTSERPKTEPTTDRPESREPRGFGRPERPAYGDRGFKKNAPSGGFSKGRSYDRDRETTDNNAEGEDLGENRPVRPAREFKTDGPDRERKRSFPKGDNDKGDRQNFGRDAYKSFGGERNSDDRTDRKPYDRDAKKSFGKDKRSDRDDRRTPSPKKEFDRRADGTPAEAPFYNLKRYNEKEVKRKPRNTDDSIRLNRYIANAGVCSRREADSLIESGEIKVNGEVVTEMGYLVKPGDTIHYGKKLLSREKQVYVLLNKPKDFITTTEDPEGRKTVMDLIATATKERIFPVGRLDRNTTGLLLFTNDGEVAQKLTHPSHKNSKIYQVELDKPITKDHFEQIQNGLELEDGKAIVDDLAIITDNNKFLGIEIHIGKNRIVRRIFEHLGYDVVSLDRVQYAGLTKKDLPRGKWRFLSEKEVIRLKYFM